MPKVIAPHPPQPTTQPPEPVSPPPKPTPTEAPPPGTTAPGPVPVPPLAPAPQEAEFDKDSKEAVKPEKDNHEGSSKGQPDEGKRKEEASQGEEMTKKRWAMRRQGGEGSSNLFKELRRPENLKKLIATVLLMLVLALHLAYVKRTCTRTESLVTGLVEME